MFLKPKRSLVKLPFSICDMEAVSPWNPRRCSKSVSLSDLKRFFKKVWVAMMNW